MYLWGNAITGVFFRKQKYFETFRKKTVEFGTEFTCSGNCMFSTESNKRKQIKIFTKEITFLLENRKLYSAPDYEGY